ncbi:MAG: LysR family transcriptional regulator [Angelakisella sp.]
MTDRELLYIKTISEEQSISKAATKLFITQPSLSQSIQRLEATLGTKLFTRTSNKLTLTFAGERYCQMASRILKIYNDFELEVSDISNLKKGRVTIGITVFLATYLLPDLLTEFRKKCPNIEVHIVEETSTKLEKLLMAGELDFALMHSSPPPGEVPGTGVDFHLLHHDPFLLATKKDHPLCSDSRVVAGYEFPVVELDRFAEEQFILVTRGQRIREVSDLILSRSGIVPHVALSTKSFETARRLAFQGIGVTFVPRQYIDIFHSDYEGDYFSLEDHCHPYWTLGLAVSKNSYLSKAALCLMEMICHRFNKMLPEQFDNRG